MERRMMTGTQGAEAHKVQTRHGLIRFTQHDQNVVFLDNQSIPVIDVVTQCSDARQRERDASTLYCIDLVSSSLALTLCRDPIPQK